LLGVVALLSTITPAMKYVLEHSGLTFLSIANGRIVIGFLFLTVMTACWDWKGLRALTLSDGARFGALGLLGVGSYVVAAYGLLYTNVTHYALIYSLLPTFTAFFSWCLSKEQVSWSGFSGILLSWAGCLAALATNLEGGAIEVSVSVHPHDGSPYCHEYAHCQTAWGADSQHGHVRKQCRFGIWLFDGME
jgi:drug/metabolite transporter (DMT)-like permease